MTVEQEQRAIELSAAGQSPTAIAAALRLPLGPVAAFLRDPVTRLAINEIRGDPLREAARYLASIAQECQRVLNEIVHDPNVPPATRANAAVSVNRLNLDYHERSDTRSRLQAVEAWIAVQEAEKKRRQTADDTDPDDTALYTPEKS